jgi:hypothetical protein
MPIERRNAFIVSMRVTNVKTAGVSCAARFSGTHNTYRRQKIQPHTSNVLPMPNWRPRNE